MRRMTRRNLTRPTPATSLGSHPTPTPFGSSSFPIPFRPKPNQTGEQHHINNPRPKHHSPLRLESLQKIALESPQLPLCSVFCFPSEQSLLVVSGTPLLLITSLISLRLIMPAISFPSPPPLPLRFRRQPRPIGVLAKAHCIYRPDSPSNASVFFPGVIGPSRADWQSSCAILASKVAVSQQQPQQQHHHNQGDDSSSNAAGDSEQIHDGEVSPDLGVNNHKVPGGCGSLDLVPVGKPSGNLLPRPLTIADLAPAPMHGSQVRVAYQGVPGAYSEAAAGKAYPGCEAIPCDQFEVAFQAVELWIADRAVLPVENSLGGSIHRNYDLLLRHRLHIVGEVQLPVHHCLLALPGVRPEYLSRVISHPQALAQCELTLTKMGLNVVREAVDDTAGAAEYVAAHGLRDTAAIASARAAELYGLEVLADGIQDDSSNVTRFVMLAREPIIPRTDRPFKTSIVFAHDLEGTSVLFKVLSAFAFRDISLTKIESRPHRGHPLRIQEVDGYGGSATAKHFEYMFYVDFEASMADVRAQNALAEIQEFTSFLRVLGSYPMDMTPWHAGTSSSGDTSSSPSTSSPRRYY